MLTAQQQEERKTYIGASEAAAVLGLSRYSTPLNVWAIKTGNIPYPEEESLPAWVGVELEEVVAKRFMLETGKRVHKVNDTIYHPQYPFLACHIDRKVVGEDTILQCKSASAYKQSDWKDEEIPTEYIIQEYHELACTCYKKAIIACLIGNHKFVMREILYDAKIINDLVAKEVAFWNTFVVPKIMPIQIQAGDSSVLYQLFPLAESKEVVQLGDEATRLVESLDSLAADRKILDLEIEKNRNELKALLKDHESGEAGKFIVSWKNIKKAAYSVPEKSYRELKYHIKREAQ